jgi:hypothetical protein
VLQNSDAKWTHHGDTRNTIIEVQVNRSQYEWDEYNYEDEETEMGAAYFTHRVHGMQVPKGFMAIRLCSGHENTWRLQGNSNEKFVAAPHWCGTIVVT